MRNSLIALAMALGLSTPALAGINLVTNGGFESNGGNGRLGWNTNATGWSVQDPGQGLSYMSLFGPGTADTSGANGQYGFLGLWGPGNGVNNGLPATSPAGGYYVAMDGDFQTSALTQTINGLTPGDKYKVSFYWAASQQEGFYGDTNQSITVSLGSQSFTTPTVTNPSQGFSGWYQQSFTYTANSASETLAFLANGNLPVPPFALLDGVSLTAAPEPATWALMLAGFGGLGFAAYRRNRKPLATA
jgi:hypothetical protein